jgi:hypothetical protein
MKFTVDMLNEITPKGLIAMIKQQQFTPEQKKLTSLLLNYGFGDGQKVRDFHDNDAPTIGRLHKWDYETAVNKVAKHLGFDRTQTILFFDIASFCYEKGFHSPGETRPLYFGEIEKAIRYARRQPKQK